MPPIIPSPRAAAIRTRLLGWYASAKRDLPWRGETDPYRILVSEIMLQQTRVAVVKDRYREFLQRFPDVSSLAAAGEQSVLAAWSGLGYYRRARNLQAAAREIKAGGRFPETTEELLELPGIGRYTAAALSSIAFGHAAPVVDGNVQRVLRRLIGRNLKDKDYWQCAGELIDFRRPGDFNQAMMELGALVCLPGQPLCSECPISRFCSTRAPHPRSAKPVRRKAQIRCALIVNDGRVLLQQRSRSASLMPAMWELPVLDRRTRGLRPIFSLRHAITETDYHVLVFRVAVRPAARKERWFSISSLEDTALTGLARKILKRCSLSPASAEHCGVKI